jgi:hypothetical protein
MNVRQEARRQVKERKHLQAVEEKGFKAAGLDPTQARLKAEKAANALVSKAAKTRKAPVEVEKPERSSSALGILASLVGGKVRFALGAMLLGGCLVWMHQNDLIPGRKLKAMATEAIESKDFKQLADVDKLKANLQDMTQEVNMVDLKTAATKSRKPLSLPMAPEWLAKPLGSFCAGAAGLLLICSALMSGRKVAVLVVVAVVAFAAQWAL